MQPVASTPKPLHVADKLPLAIGLNAASSQSRQSVFEQPGFQLALFDQAERMRLVDPNRLHPPDPRGQLVKALREYVGANLERSPGR